jgi:membrane protein DedA with SNARE-associated domain
MRALGFLLAAIIGALACGGLFFAVGVFAALRAGERAFAWVVAVVTVIGVLGGAWIGARVFRWLAAPRDEPPAG